MIFGQLAFIARSGEMVSGNDRLAWVAIKDVGGPHLSLACLAAVPSLWILAPRASQSSRHPTGARVLRFS